jgi:hypothetical protein
MEPFLVPLAVVLDVWTITHAVTATVPVGAPVSTVTEPVRNESNLYFESWINFGRESEWLNLF